MAVVPWPAGVTFTPDLNSISGIKPYLDPIATEMEGGNTRTRARPGDNVGSLAQTIIMPVAQCATFRAWVKTTLNNGTARFSAKVWTGAGFETKVCQFEKGISPTYKPIGTRAVAVSMTLRIYDI
jgi:hypothetical protein